MGTGITESHQRLVEIIKANEKALKLKPKVRKHTGSGDWAKLDTNEINDVVALIVTYLNLTGGSIGNFQLYELLQVYFGDSNARDEVNECVRRSLLK